jgi:phospholipid transport system substrate-binding protein
MVTRAAPGQTSTNAAVRWLSLLFITAALAGLAPGPAFADPAVKFMQRVARELLVAQRKRSGQQFASVIKRRAAIPAISLHALGPYARRLPKSQRQRYYTGVTNFMARYAAKEAPKYPVARADVIGRSYRDAYGIGVDMRVLLNDGNSYNVRWLLSRSGKTFRVRDAQVLGFWMTPFMKSLFNSYIQQNGNSVMALVNAMSPR